MDAGEMLITLGHKAERVHSSKAELGAAEPQSCLAKAVPLKGSSATEQTPLLFTACVAHPQNVGMTVCMHGSGGL